VACRLELGGWDVAELAVQAAVVEPPDKAAPPVPDLVKLDFTAAAITASGVVI
jgi:hypothetical protein